MDTLLYSRKAIPSELKDAIAGFCPEGELPILALTDREFQIYAESRLYRDIFIETCDGSGIAALDPIAGNPTKASYVKLLGIDFANEPRDVDTAVMGNIVRALPALFNIEKLRIRLVREDLWDFAGTISNALCAYPLTHLSHLFLEDHFDLQRIVDAQAHLKVLGVFWMWEHRKLLSLVNHLNGRSLCVVGLNRHRTYTGSYMSLDLHPSVLSLENAEDLCDILQESEEVVASRDGLELDWVKVETAFISIETVPHLQVLEALMLSLSKLPSLSLVGFYVKPGLLKAWKWDPPKEVARTYVVSNWSGVPEEFSKLRVVFEGPEREFIKFISTY